MSEKYHKVYKSGVEKLFRLVKWSGPEFLNRGKELSRFIGEAT